MLPLPFRGHAGAGRLKGSRHWNVHLRMPGHVATTSMPLSRHFALCVLRTTHTNTHTIRTMIYEQLSLVFHVCLCVWIPHNCMTSTVRFVFAVQTQRRAPTASRIKVRPVLIAEGLVHHAVCHFAVRFRSMVGDSGPMQDRSAILGQV